jgi:serine/threonine protein kinase
MPRLQTACPVCSFPLLYIPDSDLKCLLVMFRIVEDDMPPIPEGCSQFLQDFLTRCFNKDPTKRPSAELLFEHPWLKKNWGAHKVRSLLFLDHSKFIKPFGLQELRPQDSIPFLRRVSADLHKSEVVRYLSQIEMPESPASDGFPHHSNEFVSGSPSGHRAHPIQPMADNNISPREHSFVKTTFSKRPSSSHYFLRS